MDSTESETKMNDRMINSETMGKSQSPTPVMFFSFGMFIIDEITFPPSSSIKSITNLPGGAGLYALLGARLICPPPHSQTLSWILDAGSDFPPAIARQIQNWNTSTLIRYDTSRLTTRAWNGYAEGDSDVRSFRYLTAKRRLDVEDLDDRLAMGKAWHLVCSAGRCTEVIGKLDRKRAKHSSSNGNEGRILVWEPIPDKCTPEEIKAIRTSITKVNIVSPNADELRALFQHDQNRNQDDLVNDLMNWNWTTNPTEPAPQNTACLVREGKNGSTIYFPPTSFQANNGSRHISKLHLPAYHDASTAHKVIDPTGGGNTYLGALTVVLAYLYPNRTQRGSVMEYSGDKSSMELPPVISLIQRWVASLSLSIPGGLSVYAQTLVVAAVAACVAASFAIEQHGVPELVRPGRNDRDGCLATEMELELELWGGEAVEHRVRMYLDRVRDEVEQQLRGLCCG